MIETYRVTFPGPVGKVNGGIAATVVDLDGAVTLGSLEFSLGERIAKYLRGIKVTAARCVVCYPALLSDRSAGTGTVFAGATTVGAVRVGTFQVERLSDASST